VIYVNGLVRRLSNWTDETATWINGLGWRLSSIRDFQRSLISFALRNISKICGVADGA
jgi:hypothetical protein